MNWTFILETFLLTLRGVPVTLLIAGVSILLSIGPRFSWHLAESTRLKE